MSKKAAKALTRLLTTSQPEEWIAAWRKQASIEGMGLSEFVGKCCNNGLPYDVVQKLPKRVIPGRRASNKDKS